MKTFGEFLAMSGIIALILSAIPLFGFGLSFAFG